MLIEEEQFSEQRRKEAEDMLSSYSGSSGSGTSLLKSNDLDYYALISPRSVIQSDE
jgi:hypothetical protein